MKTTIFLMILLSLAACNKGHKGSRPGLSTQGTTIPSTGDLSTAPQPDPTDPQDQSQLQTDGTTPIAKNYESPNLVIDYSSKTAAGKIMIREADAARLFKRLAIHAEKREVDSVMLKVAKHIMCQEDVCTILINYKDAEISANENMGKKDSKFLPSIRTFKGKNLTLFGLKKVALITLDGKDAELLFSVMQVPEVSLNEDGKIILEKQGQGEAPFSCRVEKGAEASEDKYTCAVKLQAARGSVIVAQ